MRRAGRDRTVDQFTGWSTEPIALRQGQTPDGARWLLDSLTGMHAPPRGGHDVHDDLGGNSLVVRARALSAELLRGDDRRWRHSQAVAAQAGRVIGAVPAAERATLVAAAWLHDIGYAGPTHRYGFHPLDGACYLLARTWPAEVAGLVAHHSGARFVAAVRGLALPLEMFDPRRYGSGPLADALTYADQTTSPDGRQVTVEQRFTDVLRRHGPDSPTARVHAIRGPVIRSAVRRVEQRLGRDAG